MANGQSREKRTQALATPRESKAMPHVILSSRNAAKSTPLIQAEREVGVFKREEAAQRDAHT
jgi:hypothetical protein